MRPPVRSFLIPALAAGVLTACHAKPAPAPAPTPAAAPPVVITNPPPQQMTAPPPVAKPSGPTEAEIAAEVSRVTNAIGQPIYFEYDKDVIRDSERAALDAKVPLLQQYPQLRIRIAGNTDERGSDEYNLALGQRRAAAAQRYLNGRGIESSRIDIVSYGEERPAMTGEGEAAWSRNRRDEFTIVAGADQIRPRGR